jgi:hypothetical protein
LTEPIINRRIYTFVARSGLSNAKNAVSGLRFRSNEGEYCVLISHDVTQSESTDREVEFLISVPEVSSSQPGDQIS